MLHWTSEDILHLSKVKKTLSDKMAEINRVEALELEERLLGSQPTETSNVPTTSNDAKEASETVVTNVEEGNCCSR